MSQSASVGHTPYTCHIMRNHAGKYDGVVGVLGAIQAVAALRQAV